MFLSGVVAFHTGARGLPETWDGRRRSPSLVSLRAGLSSARLLPRSGGAGPCDCLRTAKGWAPGHHPGPPASLWPRSLQTPAHTASRPGPTRTHAQPSGQPNTAPEDCSRWGSGQGPTEGPLAQAQAGQVVGLGAGPAVAQHQLAAVPAAEALVLGPLPLGPRSAPPALLPAPFALLLRGQGRRGLGAGGTRHAAC